jgi:hypothetical protein
VIILALAAASGEVRRVLARSFGRRSGARAGGPDAPATETP